MLRTLGEAAAPTLFGYVSQYVFGGPAAAGSAGGAVDSTHSVSASGATGLGYTFLVFLVPLMAAGLLACSPCAPIHGTWPPPRRPSGKSAKHLSMITRSFRAQAGNPLAEHATPAAPIPGAAARLVQRPEAAVDPAVGISLGSPQPASFPTGSASDPR